MLILNSNNLEIAQARENVSLKCLAERTGLCFGTLRNAKLGKPCKPETVHSIAKALNVDPAELVKKE